MTVDKFITSNMIMLPSKIRETWCFLAGSIGLLLVWTFTRLPEFLPLFTYIHTNINIYWRSLNWLPRFKIKNKTWMKITHLHHWHTINFFLWKYFRVFWICYHSEYLIYNLWMNILFSQIADLVIRNDFSSLI